MGATASNCYGQVEKPPEEVAKEQEPPRERKPLVVVGSMAANLVLGVDRLPRAGETICATSCATFPGGKGANQAAAAARLGYKTFFVGQFGKDANAELMRAALAESGTDISLCREVDGVTGHAAIMLQPSGENSIVVVPGVNRAGWDISADISQAIRDAGMLLLQREIPEEVNTVVAQIAQQSGVPVVLDAGGLEGPISEELFKCITVISPNETELARMTGMPTNTAEEIMAAAQSLVDRGVEAVLLKLGAKGSMMLRTSGLPPVVEKALPVQKIVDTTGAGDCYTASWAVASLDNRSSSDSMKFASAAAAICVQRPGAMTSLPTLEEVKQLLG